MTAARTLAAAILALALSGCTTHTEMITSWAAPGASKANVKKILVLGISQDTSTRRTFEDDFAGKLKAKGYEAVPGYTWVPDAAKLDQAALAQQIKAEAVTHVLVTRLVGKKAVATEVPATVTYAPYGPGYYGSWGTYWSYGYGTVYSPGYTTVNDVVTLETNLYDATKPEKDSLVWSGQSETWTDPTPTPSKSKIDSVIDKILYEMRLKKVV